MKQILGLDLGTNSIGWALINVEQKQIIKAGSRIIPMDAATIGNYEKGNLQSPASQRTTFRGTRRLYQRATLRRERLLRVLHTLHFLPSHFENQIDFAEHPGQFKNHGEPLLPYQKEENGKNTFIFQESFHEMIEDFIKSQPELVSNGKKVPYDWTIYYLRKKALTKPISKEELAWIILNFNTKRGYYQLRGENEELKTNKNEEYKSLQVKSIEKLGVNSKKKGENWYQINYENGACQKKSTSFPPRHVGEQVDLIITTNYNKDGSIKTDKEGNPLIKVRDPKEDDWTLMKKRTEFLIDKSHESVGTYIYNHLISDPHVKIRGRLVHTIERKFYKDELVSILNKQAEFLPELKDKALLEKCIEELYHNNENHKVSLRNKGFTNLFINDIIFYQRPLKSKKSEISNCPFEHYVFKDPLTGEKKIQFIKCIPKSNPLYQEFRIWQFIKNLKIYTRNKVVNGKLYNDEISIKSSEDACKLYDWLSERKEVTEEQLLRAPIFNLGKNISNYRWNHVEGKSYPCNETHYTFQKALKNVKGSPKLNFAQEMDLWHILYSVDDRFDLDKALHSFAKKNGLDPDSFALSLIDTDPYPADYGAYSEKAIKKLLQLMRAGKYWKKENIDAHTKERIEHIINGEVDESISNRTREKSITLQKLEDFQYLPLWLASYIVYNRHSENDDTQIWKAPDDIDLYLQKQFRPNSLRNPVVETVLREALRVTKDIWTTYGKIDEIHIEMGRDLKQPKDKRIKDMQRTLENQRVNWHIRYLLQEFANPEYNIDSVRPQSPGQQELLKIYEGDVLNSNIAIPDDIIDIISHLNNPSKPIAKSEIMRYRLWLEQRYLSPYTGQPIPLSKLFTPAYEIEHIIPQSRYFDDSLSNKVICESEVNKAKGRMLGYEFILKQGGSIIQGGQGKIFTVLDKTQYEEFVKQHYSHNHGKMTKLLLENIPDSFIKRQLNDSRYMAKKALEIFSHLVRDDNGDDEAISKNVIASKGSITDRLKKEWGINDIWNKIITPRFERMNKLTGTHDFGDWVTKKGKQYFQINIPLAISQGFSKKRIDHRHHAMDAIIIACTTRNHINFLNNSSAASSLKDERRDLRRQLCEKKYTDDKGNYVWQFIKPWSTFTQDVHEELRSIIVSFKQNLRIINKMDNYYWHYVNGQKILSRQIKGDGWSVRKSLHKATISGAVRLQEKKTVKFSVALKHIDSICDKGKKHIIKAVIKSYNHYDEKNILKYFKDRKYSINDLDFSKLEIYSIPTEAKLTANRVNVDESFNEKTINSVTDSGIRRILKCHLHKYDDINGKEHPERAFSPEGLVEMNSHIKELNEGKDHKTIVKVRKFESLGNKFTIGTRGSKGLKYVEADKGTNLFYAIYANEDGKRSFESIPLNIAVERLKNSESIAPRQNGNGDKLLFTLSPYDLVYLPEEGNEHIDQNIDRDRIYKFVSSTGGRSFFIPYNVANIIEDKKEFEPLNKMERSIDVDGPMIKESCIKININRLGNIL